MRLGLFGGTFDPVHFGHLILAEQCREQCELDEVWLIPSGMPPHKRQKPISDARHRIEMLELAVSGLKQFAVSRMEIDREGITYTVDTLQQLHDQDPTRELFFLIGADSLSDLPSWREPERISELATIVAVNRGDRPLPDSGELVAKLGSCLASRLRFVEMPGVDISATDIRSRVRAGHSIRFLVPRAVEMYIAEHRLYRE